jgi:hypothetical protein
LPNPHARTSVHVRVCFLVEHPFVVLVQLRDRFVVGVGVIHEVFAFFFVRGRRGIVAPRAATARLLVVVFLVIARRHGATLLRRGLGRRLPVKAENKMVRGGSGENQMAYIIISLYAPFFRNAKET